MSTHAENRGIVAGKLFVLGQRLPGKTSSYSDYATDNVKPGDIVTLKRDDRTPAPYFSVVDKNGNILKDNVIVTIDAIELKEYVEPTPEVEVEAVVPAFSVHVGGGMTIIEFGKELTAKQVAAVFKAAGLE